MTESTKDNNPKNEPVVSYDGYDYSDFWKGRDYEDQADKIAVSRLFSLVKGPHHKFIDVGAGKGRMAPLYENTWDKFVLFDSSRQQLEIAEKDIIHPDKAEFVVGTLEKMPFPDASFNAALCLRAFHYVVDAAAVVKEIGRILKPEGYLILEIPNKLHFKNRLGALLGKNSQNIFSADPINIATKGDSIFLNHNPKTILKLLEANNLRVIETLSVSNFRSGFLKKALPISALLKLEKLTQKVLAPLWFGPSSYFLVRKSKLS